MNYMRYLSAAALTGLAASLGVSMVDAAPAHRRDARAADRYRDGTYTATGQYGNLPSFLTVTVVLVGGRITGTTVKTHATDPTSLDYQRRFAAAVPVAVQGKPIAEVKVGRLAGSSGCPIGFNAALDAIRAKATQG